MREACTNCLQPVNGYGHLCDECAKIAAGGWYEGTVWSDPVPRYSDETGRESDIVWLEMLRHRRMRSRLQARVRAKHGI